MSDADAKAEPPHLTIEIRNTIDLVLYIDEAMKAL
jgi:hypothetical protein